MNDWQANVLAELLADGHRGIAADLLLDLGLEMISDDWLILPSVSRCHGLAPGEGGTEGGGSCFCKTWGASDRVAPGREMVFGWAEGRGHKNGYAHCRGDSSGYGQGDGDGKGGGFLTKGYGLGDGSNNDGW